MEPPVFPAGARHSVRAAPGSSADLAFPHPTGTPPFKFEWSRAGASLDDRFTSSEDAGGVRLAVTAARTGDSGVYTLQASNAAGKDTARVRLEVAADEAPSGDDPPAFLRRLQDLTVKVGTRTRFLVEIVSSTECKVTWYRNERRLMEAERVALVRDGTFWCADIATVSVDDTGRWTCTAENAGGRASCSAHLNVLVPKAYKRPEFVEELRALLTEQGTVSLECKVVGVPTPVLRWFKDSREIKAGDVFALTANAEDPTSLGTYTCEAVNCMGRAYSSSKVHVVGRGSREGSTKPITSGVTLESPPIFTKELEDKYVKVSEPLHLSCHIVVPPWPRSVVWYNKEGKVEPGERYLVVEDGVGGYLLEVPSAEWPDEGEWKCVATSAGGRIGFSSCYVSMDVPKNYRKPRFMENLQAVLTEEGLVSFECKVVGFPTPVLSWFKDGQELKPGDVYQLTGTNSLGSYCCIARNCMGQASSSAELTVEDIQNQLNEEEKLQLFSKNQAPKFVQGLKSVEAKIDEPFRFTIKVAIPPEPSLQWYRDDQPVDDSSRCNHGKEERGVFYLDIQGLEFLDQAEWKCVAVNDFGHSVTSCFLKLIIPRHYKKPRFLENLQAILSEEGAVNLECKVIGVPQPVLKWYKDGEELKPGDIHRIISGQDGTCCLGTYTCEAQNCMGIAASSASLLGFDDSMKAKATKKKAEEQALQRNVSLSTIHEERSSQMYDTPVGDITLDDKAEISFSFDGKEVSVSLYETPDLTEEDAIQIMEMYADQISENVTEHNVAELPPLRFVKETSTSGNLLMEAIIIDVSPDYFASPEEDLRTEADVEDISIADENGPPQLSLDQDIGGEDYLEKTMELLSNEKADIIPRKLSRKKSDSQRSADDYFSLSLDQTLSEDKKDDETQIFSESFASARSLGKPKSKSSKPSLEDGQESSDVTKTILFKEEVPKIDEVETPVVKPKQERRNSRSSRRSSSGSEKSFGKSKEELVKTPLALEEKPKKSSITNEDFKTIMTNVSLSLSKVINNVQIIERDIILKSELMSSAATASRSLEIISSLIKPLSEIHSIADATKELTMESKEVCTQSSSTLFNNLPQPLKVLQQSLTIIEKCIDVESDNKTLVKKTCVAFIETCGEEVENLLNLFTSVIEKDYLILDLKMLSDINLLLNDMKNVIKFSADTIKARNLISEACEIKHEEATVESKHLRDTQKALFELKSPLSSLLRIVDSGKFIDVTKVKSSEIILNDMSASVQDLQAALEQIEALSIKESTTSLNKYNTEIIETVMESVLKLRSSFEQLSTETKTEDDDEVLNQALKSIRSNLNEISSHIENIEHNVGSFDILQSDNKLEMLQRMAQILISLENNLPRLETMSGIKPHMNVFHKNLTRVLENVIESNEAPKYFTLIDICDAVKRVNTSIKNIETDSILSLASLSNTLQIIQNTFVNNVFESELNCSILSNLSDVLLSIQEALNHADEISLQLESEQIQDIVTQDYEINKACVVYEHIDHTIAVINTVKAIETTQELKNSLSPVLESICPILEELKRSIASMKPVDIPEEEHILEISEASSVKTVASPLFELNQNILVLNQVIVENIESLKENNEIMTAIAEPLHELHTTLQILQQNVISQYDEDVTPYSVSVNIISAVQNLQSCIVLVQEQQGVEGVDEMSTLEDISGIKTTAETIPSDRLVLPTAEQTEVESSAVPFDQDVVPSATAQALHTLNKHVTILQNPEVLDALDTLSEVSDYSSLKSVALGLGELHAGIEEILHPFVMENSTDIINLINTSKLAAIAEPMQELHQSLSILDTSNIPIYEHILDLSTEKIHSVLESVSGFKEYLVKCIQVLFPAMETADKTIEISNTVETLREVCENLKFIIGTSKSLSAKTPVKQEIIMLEETVDCLLDATDVVKGIQIQRIKAITEQLFDRIVTVQEELLQYTPQTPEKLVEEAKLIQAIDEIENHIAVLEQYDFVDLSRASDITSCATPTMAMELESESLFQMDDILQNAVNVLQDSAQETPLADLMILEDFFKTCKSEFTIIRLLISKSLTQKKIIRLIQEFTFLQSFIKDFKSKRLQLQLSADIDGYLKIFFLEASGNLKIVQNSLLKLVNSQSELLFSGPIMKLKNTQQELRNILKKEETEGYKDLIDQFISAVEIAKPILQTIEIDIIEELKHPSVQKSQTDRALIEEQLECLLKLTEEQSVASIASKKTRNVFDKISSCIQKHQEYEDATGNGKNLIILKCLSECAEILQTSFLKMKEQTKEKIEDKVLKSVLTEMLEPLQALHSQLVNVQEQVASGIEEKSISIDITSTESIIEAVSEIHKEMVQQVESTKANFNSDNISLIMAADNEIHVIQDTLRLLEDIPAIQELKEITKPIADVEDSLHHIMSWPDVEIQEKPSKDLSQCVEQYTEIIQVLEEILTTVPVSELEESLNIARELRDHIAASEFGLSRVDEEEQKHVQLAHQLQNALTTLSIQVCDSNQELGSEINPDLLKRLAIYTTQLQNDLTVPGITEGQPAISTPPEMVAEDQKVYDDLVLESVKDFIELPLVASTSEQTVSKENKIKIDELGDQNIDAVLKSVTETKAIEITDDISINTGAVTGVIQEVDQVKLLESEDISIKKVLNISEESSEFTGEAKIVPIESIAEKVEKTGVLKNSIENFLSEGLTETLNNISTVINIEELKQAVCIAKELHSKLSTERNEIQEELGPIQFEQVINAQGELVQQLQNALLTLQEQISENYQQLEVVCNTSSLQKVADATISLQTNLADVAKVELGDQNIDAVLESVTETNAIEITDDTSINTGAVAGVIQEADQVKLLESEDISIKKVLNISEESSEFTGEAKIVPIESIAEKVEKTGVLKNSIENFLSEGLTETLNNISTVINIEELKQAVCIAKELHSKLSTERNEIQEELGPIQFEQVINAQGQLVQQLQNALLTLQEQIFENYQQLEVVCNTSSLQKVADATISLQTNLADVAKVELGDQNIDAVLESVIETKAIEITDDTSINTGAVTGVIQEVDQVKLLESEDISIKKVLNISEESSEFTGEAKIVPIESIAEKVEKTGALKNSIENFLSEGLTETLNNISTVINIEALKQTVCIAKELHSKLSTERNEIQEELGPIQFEQVINAQGQLVQQLQNALLTLQEQIFENYQQLEVVCNTSSLQKVADATISLQTNLADVAKVELGDQNIDAVLESVTETKVIEITDDTSINTGAVTGVIQEVDQVKLLESEDISITKVLNISEESSEFTGEAKIVPIESIAEKVEKTGALKNSIENFLSEGLTETLNNISTVINIEALKQTVCIAKELHSKLSTEQNEIQEELGPIQFEQVINAQGQLVQQLQNALLTLQEQIFENYQQLEVVCNTSSLQKVENATISLQTNLADVAKVELGDESKLTGHVKDQPLTLILGEEHKHLATPVISVLETNEIVSFDATQDTSESPVLITPQEKTVKVALQTLTKEAEIIKPVVDTESQATTPEYKGEERAAHNKFTHLDAVKQSIHDFTCSDLDEVIENIVSVVKVEDLKQTLHIAKELEENIAKVEIQEELESFESSLEKEKLVNLIQKLQNALINVQEQIFDNNEHLKTICDVSKLQQVADVAINLQNKLSAAISAYHEIEEQVSIDSNATLAPSMTVEAIVAYDLIEPVALEQDIVEEEINVQNHGVKSTTDSDQRVLAKSVAEITQACSDEGTQIEIIEVLAGNVGKDETISAKKEVADMIFAQARETVQTPSSEKVTKDEIPEDGSSPSRYEPVHSEQIKPIAVNEELVTDGAVMESVQPSSTDNVLVTPSLESETLSHHIEAFISGGVPEAIEELAVLTSSSDLSETVNMAKELLKSICVESQPLSLEETSSLVKDSLPQQATLKQKLYQALSTLQAKVVNATHEFTPTPLLEKLESISGAVMHLQDDLSLAASIQTEPLLSEILTETTKEDSMKILENLLQEVSDKIDLSSIRAPEDNDALRDSLDEVQTVIIKLKRDFDGANDTLNETLEDLECSVRSVQLQINEDSPPDLLKEACATLQLLVNNMGETGESCISESVSKNIVLKDIFDKCSNESEQTLKLLEIASNVDKKNLSHLSDIIASLNNLTDTIKFLRTGFTGNADTLIEKGTEIIQSLNQIEDKVFSIEKELEALDTLPSTVRDNIVAAVHAVYGSISNMRSTVTSTQKQYMFENFGNPTESLLRSIKNLNSLNALLTESEKAQCKNISKTLRNVLNHFEDIKFYINLDKTARLPSDAAFTKIILEELKSNINLISSMKRLSSDVKDKVNSTLKSVDSNLRSIEARSTLEVKEKIPMYKLIAAQVLDVTTCLKYDLSKRKNQDQLGSIEPGVIEILTTQEGVKEESAELIDVTDMRQVKKPEKDIFGEIVEKDQEFEPELFISSQTCPALSQEVPVTKVETEVLDYEDAIPSTSKQAREKDAKLMEAETKISLLEKDDLSLRNEDSIKKQVIENIQQEHIIKQAETEVDKGLEDYERVHGEIPLVKDLEKPVTETTDQKQSLAEHDQQEGGKHNIRKVCDRIDSKQLKLEEKNEQEEGNQKTIAAQKLIEQKESKIINAAIQEPDNDNTKEEAKEASTSKTHTLMLKEVIDGGEPNYKQVKDQPEIEVKILKKSDNKSLVQEEQSNAGKTMIENDLQQQKEKVEIKHSEEQKLRHEEIRAQKIKAYAEKAKQEIELSNQTVIEEKERRDAELKSESDQKLKQEEATRTQEEKKMTSLTIVEKEGQEVKTVQKEEDKEEILQQEQGTKKPEASEKLSEQYPEEQTFGERVITMEAPEQHDDKRSKKADKEVQLSSVKDQENVGQDDKVYTEIDKPDYEELNREKTEEHEKIEIENLGNKILEKQKFKGETLETKKMDQEKLELETQETKELVLDQKILELKQEKEQIEIIEDENKLKQQELEHLENENLEKANIEEDNPLKNKLKEYELASPVNEKLEEQKLEKAKSEKEKPEGVKLDKLNLEAEMLEKERLKDENLEKDSKEKLEREKLEKTTSELEIKPQEKEKDDTEKQEDENLIREKQERKKLEAEKLNKENLEQEKQELQKNQEEPKLEADKLREGKKEKKQLKESKKEKEKLRKEEQEKEQVGKEKQGKKGLEEEKPQQEKLDREKQERKTPGNEEQEIETLDAEKLEKEKMEAMNLEKEKQQRDKLKEEELEEVKQQYSEGKEKLEAEKLKKGKKEAEKLERENLQKDKVKAEKQEKEKLDAEKLEKEKVEAEKLEKQKQQRVGEEQEKEELEAAKSKKEKVVADKLEKEKLQKVKQDKQKQEQEPQEKEKLEAEKLNKEKEEAGKVEKGIPQKEKQEKDKLEKVQQENEKHEAEKLENEKLLKTKLEKEKREKEQQEKLEAENLEKEKVEADKLKKERIQSDDLEKEIREKKQQEKEKLDYEKLEKEKVEAEKLEKEKQQKVIQQKEQREKELEAAKSKDKKEEAEKLEKEKLHIEIQQKEQRENEVEEKEEPEAVKSKEEKVEDGKLEKEKREQAKENLEQEQHAKEKVGAEKLEKGYLQKEKLEIDEIDKKQQENKILETEKLLNAKLEKDKQEREKREKELQEKLEAENLENRNMAANKLEKEIIQKDKVEKEKRENEQHEKQKLKAENFEKEKVEAEKLEKEKFKKEEQEKVQQENEKLEAEKLENEKLLKAELEKEKRQKEQQEKLEAEKLETEKLLKAKLEKEKREKEQQDKLEAAKLEKEKIQLDNLEKVKRENEQQEKEKLEAEKLEKEKAEAEKLKKEKLQKEKQKKVQQENEKLEAEKLENEKLLKAKLEKEKQEKEKREQEQQEKVKAENLEKEKVKAEKLDKEKLQKKKQEKVQQENEQLEAEKLENEKLLQDKLEKEIQEKEKREKEQQEKVEAENLEKEKVKAEEMKKEKIQKDEVEKVKQDKEKREKEQQEKEKLKAEELEKKKADAEKLKKEKLRKERQEKDKQEKVQQENEKLEAEKLENEKLLKAKLEKEKQEKEKREKEKQEKLEAENLEKEKVEAEEMKKEKIQKDEVGKVKQDKEKREKEQQEKEKLKTEELEKKKADAEKLKKEKLQKEKQEKDKQEKAQQENEKLEAEKLGNEKLLKAKLEKEKQEKEKQGKEQQEKLEAENLEKEKLEAEKLEKEKLQKAKRENELREEEKLEADKLEKEKLEAEMLKKDKLQKEEQEKEIKQKLEAEKLEKGELKKYQLEKENQEKENREKEQRETEKLEAQKLEKEKDGADNLEKEKLQKEKQEKKKMEADRLEQEKQQKLEAEKMEKEKLQKDKLHGEILENEKQQKEKIEAEQLKKVQKEKLEKENLEKERLETEKLEKNRKEKSDIEKLERQKLEKEKLHTETLQKEKQEKREQEKENVYKEKQEKEKLEAETLEKAKLVKEKQDNKKLDKEKEKEKRKKEKLEKIKLAQEKQEKEKQETEKLEKQKQEPQKQDNDRQDKAKLEPVKNEDEQKLDEQMRIQNENEDIAITEKEKKTINKLKERGEENEHILEDRKLKREEKLDAESSKINNNFKDINRREKLQSSSKERLFKENEEKIGDDINIRKQKKISQKNYHDSGFEPLREHNTDAISEIRLQDAIGIKSTKGNSIAEETYTRKLKSETKFGQDKLHMSESPRYIKEYHYEPSAIPKNEDREKPRFIDHNHRDYTMEFARPSAYREKTLEVDNVCFGKHTERAHIYKANSLMMEAQLRSSAPPRTIAPDLNRSSEPIERRPDLKQRSKALSEARTLLTEKRPASRDSRRKPVFSTYLTDRTAVEASRVKLTCSVLSSGDPKVTWYKNGVLLDNKLKYRTKYSDGLITLEVLNAVPSDSAEYSCTVENENGSVDTSATLKVYPSFEASPIPPTFTRSIRDTFHLAENELVLECRIRGQPLPTISWLKDDQPVGTNERFQAYYLADGVCRLAISHPTPADSGKYTCKAENSMWSDQITHIVNFTGKESRLSPNLTTIERSRFNRQTLESSRRPHFGNVLTDYKVTRGGTIGLQVEIRGAPNRVEWLREGRSVTETYTNARTYVEQGLYTLALSDVTERESGLYTCRAFSSHGTVDMNAAITVVQPNELEGKPAIIVGRPEKDVLISVGEDLNISFRVQGEPKSKVIFMKGIRDITNSQRVCKMTSDDYVKFTVKRSVVSDAGTYCILARNAYGCDRAFVTVVVRQRASSENLISDWTYPVEETSLSITERKYKSVPERIPGEPSVVDGGSNWLSISWPKPDPRDTAPVLAYKVESWLVGKEGGARWTELGITPLNTFDAFNLKQGEEYHFRVTPRNRYGFGESVQTSSPIGIGLAGDRPEFVDILPGQLKVLLGQTANLCCSVRGKPVPEVIWMKNGHEIEDEDARLKTSFNGFECSLTIDGINTEDEARYSCEASNEHGRASTYARLAVVTDRLIWEADAKLKRERSADAAGDYPPQFTMRLRDRRVQATYPVRLTCQVVGSPPPSVTWFKDGEEVILDTRHTKSQDEHFHTLEIAPTTLEDGGVYEAMARNSSGAISCRCSLVVDKGIRAYVAPEFCCGLEPLYRLNEGDELRISAVVEAYPTVGVTWYRDGVRLRPSRRTIMTLDRDGQIELALAFVTPRDAGVYSCTASNEVGRATTSGKVEVIEGDETFIKKRTPPVVLSPDVPYSKEPMFIRKPRSSEAQEGDTVIIQCEVVGDPKPDVYWLRDFLKPDYYRDATHFKRVGDGPEYRFEIPHAKLDYTGAYSVVARNVHGEAKAIISLQILAKDPSSTEEHNIRYGRSEVIPRFEKELTDLLCHDGDAIEFECRVSGHPEPDIRWFHYTELIRECPDFEWSLEEGTARLKIKQVTAEDEGTYLCEASNNLGKAKSSACLVVYPPGEPNTLSQRLRRPPALLSAASTPRSTPRSTPARSVSRTPGPDPRRLCSPSRQMAPKFYTYPFNKVVEEGDHVVFQCAVKGLPAPWATWDKDGVIITPSARITVKEKDEILRILEIEEVTIEDVGIYRITIENDYGRVEATARLEVITQKGKFYAGVRAISPSPRKSLTYRRRSRQD